METKDYRYTLGRQIDLNVASSVLWVMLNPSTADDTMDDPTIRKCKGFTSRWGHGSLKVVNLWPVRATNPKDLFSHDDPCGSILWQTHAVEMACFGLSHRGGVVVYAWGANADKMQTPSSVDIDEVVRRHGLTPMALGYTKSGQPRHPLMLSYDTPLEVWTPPTS